MKKTILFVILAAFSASMIISASLTLIQPDGSDVTLGSVCQIKWTASGVSSNVKILLRRPGGALVGILANNLPVSPGLYNWTVAAPAAAGESYKIHVRATDGSAEGASAVFTVKAEALPSPACGSLQLVSPMDGAQWVLGHEYQIKWTSTKRSGKVRLELVGYQGPMLGIIAENLPASGSYQWTKAGEYIGHTAPLGKYRMRVRSMDKFECFDEGDPFNLILLVKPIKLVPAPVIEGVFPIPPPGAFPSAVITPGTQLFLKGKHFDYQPVEILMVGNFPNSYNPGPVQLTKVTLEGSTKVNGFVPIFSKKGQLDQTVEIRVKNGNGTLSNPWKLKFTGRKEQKVLERKDVVLLHCGASNCSACNNFKNCTINKDPELVWPLCSNLMAISGHHYNVWGAVGYDKGYDQYQISLKNGWKFKSLQKVKWYKSSGNEELDGPYPSFPEGESNWSPKINWVVSPDDRVNYQLKIIVEGPLGTQYK